MGTIEGQGVVRYEIQSVPLLPAQYRVSTAVHDSQTHRCYDFHKRAYMFRIVPGGTTELDGIVEIPAEWHWQKYKESEGEF